MSRASPTRTMHHRIWRTHTQTARAVAGELGAVGGGSRRFSVGGRLRGELWDAANRREARGHPLVERGIAVACTCCATPTCDVTDECLVSSAQGVLAMCTSGRRATAWYRVGCRLATRGSNRHGRQAMARLPDGWVWAHSRPPVLYRFCRRFVQRGSSDMAAAWHRRGSLAVARWQRQCTSLAAAWQQNERHGGVIAPAMAWAWQRQRHGNGMGMA